MNKEQSIFEEDCTPTRGAGFSDVEKQIDVDFFMKKLAEGDISLSTEIQSVGNFGELPTFVACELIQLIAASNDGSLKRSREYLKMIIEGLGYDY